MQTLEAPSETKKTPFDAKSPPSFFGVRRWVVLLVLLLLALAFFVWFIVPLGIRNYINKRGNELPDYTFHVNSVQLGILACSVNLNEISLVKKSGDIPVPFLTSPQLHVTLQWKEILHGSFRSNIVLRQPMVNFVQGPTKEQSQTFLEPVWVEQVKQLVPLRINRFEIHGGDVHYREFDASPPIDIEMDQIELSLDNLTNSDKKQGEFPSTVHLMGRPLKRGKLEVSMAMNVDNKEPTFKDQIRLQNIPAPALNSFLAKYAGVYAKSGDLSFYSEMMSDKGSYNGYLKPFFQDLQFEPMPKDRHGIEALWASIMNGIKDLFENDNGTIATTVPVAGNYKQPGLDFFSAAFGLIKNAYFEALAQGFKSPQLAPVPEKPTKN